MSQNEPIRLDWDESRPWERHPEETEAAFTAFEYYLAQYAPREKIKAWKAYQLHHARNPNKPFPNWLQHWSQGRKPPGKKGRRNNKIMPDWDTRAAFYDRYLRRLELEKIIDRKIDAKSELLDSTIDQLRVAYEKVLEELKLFVPTGRTPLHQLVTAMKGIMDVSERIYGPSVLNDILEGEGDTEKIRSPRDILDEIGTIVDSYDPQAEEEDPAIEEEINDWYDLG